MRPPKLSSELVHLDRSSGRSGVRAPLLSEVSSDFREGHRVQDAVSWYATLSGHLDTPVHVVQFSDRVRVRIDAHHASEIERCLVPAPVQVEPPWMRIDLDHDVVLCTGAKYLLDVDVVSWTALKLPAGHVTDDRGEGIGDRPQQAVGL